MWLRYLEEWNPNPGVAGKGRSTQGWKVQRAWCLLTHYCYQDRRTQAPAACHHPPLCAMDKTPTKADFAIGKQNSDTEWQPVGPSVEGRSKMPPVTSVNRSDDQWRPQVTSRHLDGAEHRPGYFACQASRGHRNPTCPDWGGELAQPDTCRTRHAHLALVSYQWVFTICNHQFCLSDIYSLDWLRWTLW